VITAAAALHINLLAIRSRMIDSRENFIFTITKFVSGFTYNVFPDDAHLCGSLRTYNEECRQKVH